MNGFLTAFGPAIRLTLELAGAATLLLVVIGTPLAWWLAQTRCKYRELVGALTALPLVLPPTVIGFYLLIVLGPNGPGGFVAGFWGARTLAFSFEGLVIGSVIYSLPFMVAPARQAFESVDKSLLETAAGLGASPLTRFFTIGLPLASSGLIAGAVLSFAHTIGEFGVVLMIGGNIEGETKVVAVAIYDAVERLDYQNAHLLALGLVLFGFFVIALTMALGRDPRKIVR